MIVEGLGDLLRAAALAAALGVLLWLCGLVPSHAQDCIASIYDLRSGTLTASGRRLDPGALTAAHRTLRLGSYVRVTRRRDGRSVVVRIIDRGPYVRGRCIDLTPAAATAIGLTRRAGLARVRVEALR